LQNFVQILTLGPIFLDKELHSISICDSFMHAFK